MKKILLLFIATLAVLQPTIGQDCANVNALTIVVLGSSTAAGAGASTSDSTWVNRYRVHLQSLNAANQVINLGVGGYTTYNIMPTGFVAPPNRPSVVTTQNITTAFTHNPDAIIINLPSNDRQWPKEEQLANFDSLWNHSWNNGISMWICTTQPINSTNQTTNDYQAEVKDSIFARYGSYVLDFWTNLAMPNNAIDTIFAADAVHLNDLGHRTIFQSAVAENIPWTLQQSGTPNYLAWGFNLSQIPNCTSDSAEIGLIIGNCGTSDTATFSANLIVSNSTGFTNHSLVAISGLATGEFDTLIFPVLLTVSDKYQFLGTVTSTLDPSPSDNQTMVSQWIGLTPSVETIGDTGCLSSYLLLASTADSLATIHWYDNISDTAGFQTGSFLDTGPLSQSEDYFAEAVHPGTSISNSISTTTGINRWWNGYMFDIEAIQTITIDSLTVNIADTGMQTLNVFTKTGTYKGHELTSGSWTLLGQYTVHVQTNDQNVIFDIDDVEINTGAIMGFHLQMNNSSSRLTYNATGTESTRTTNELILTTGSGISYGFSQIYFPRDWNGTVHYHQEVQGCSSDRIEVHALMKPTSDIITYSGTTTPNSAVLNWNISETVNHFELRGRRLGVNNWTTSTISGIDYSKQVFGLSYNQSYEWQIRAFCTSTVGDPGNWSALDTFITSCTLPDSIFTQQVSATGAILAWNSTQSASAWEIRGRRVGNVSWTTLMVGGTQNSKTVFGLNSGTSYEWTLRRWCDTAGNKVSVWMPLTTFATSSGHRTTTESQPSFFYSSNAIELLFPSPFEHLVSPKLYTLDGKYLNINLEITNNSISIRKNGLAPGIYFITAENITTERFKIVIF